MSKKKTPRPQMCPRVKPSTLKWIRGVSAQSRLSMGEVVDKMIEHILESGEEHFYDTYLKAP